MKSCWKAACCYYLWIRWVWSRPLYSLPGQDNDCFRGNRDVSDSSRGTATAKKVYWVEIAFRCFDKAERGHLPEARTLFFRYLIYGYLSPGPRLPHTDFTLRKVQIKSKLCSLLEPQIWPEDQFSLTSSALMPFYKVTPGLELPNSTDLAKLLQCKFNASFII